jgi:hypothetical protein
MGDCRRVGLVNGIIEHLQIVSTSNYSVIANSHTLHFTTAHTKSSQSVVCSRFLVTASNTIDPSTCVFTASCPRWLLPVSQATSQLAPLRSTQ